MGRGRAAVGEGALGLGRVVVRPGVLGTGIPYEEYVVDPGFTPGPRPRSNPKSNCPPRPTRSRGTAGCPVRTCSVARSRSPVEPNSSVRRAFSASARRTSSPACAESRRRSTS